MEVSVTGAEYRIGESVPGQSVRLTIQGLITHGELISGRKRK
jgi:hypothetical protein